MAKNSKPVAKRKVCDKLDNYLITDYFPAVSHRRRITAKAKEVEQQKLIHHYVSKKCDPDENLIIEDIENKGKGVIAKNFIAKGDFICEYSGDLIELEEAKKRENKYEIDGAGCYMYFFDWSNKVWCVDATKPTDRIGRLINHSRKQPNCKTRIFVHNNKPHLIFIALTDIHTNEELLYDYGDRDRMAVKAHPWLKHT